MPIHYIIMKIAIIQSSDESELFPKRYRRACDALKKCFVAEVRDYSVYSLPLSPHKKSEVQFAERFMKAYRENDILLSLSGGYTTVCMLPYLDYDLLKLKHRYVIGYSDSTALLNALYSMSGIITVYGPSLLGSFGEYPTVNYETVQSLKNILDSKSRQITYSMCRYSSSSNYYWDSEDEKGLQYESSKPWISQDSAVCSGISVGGNLDTLIHLAGTRYLRIPENSVFFMEEAFTNPNKLKRDMDTLHRRGVFQNVTGVLFGRFFQSGTEEIVDKMNEYVLDFFSRLHLPVMVNVDFGHCFPSLSIPIGKKITVDYRGKTIKIQM